MSEFTLAPPLTAANRLVPTLQAQGYAVVDAANFAAISGCQLTDLGPLRADWAQLPPDLYLKDGGRYRRRRHASFVVDGDTCVQVPHRAHWQPLAYNALHGGMQRWFEPMLAASCAQAVWSRLVVALAQVCSATKGEQTWYVEAHQFRIDTTDGIGRPTPEGAHRDGVDFVAVILVDRHHIKGGETRVFDAAGPQGQRFTLNEPWSMMMLDDERVIHESTPIQPAGEDGHRDTLVLTFRRGGFQDELPA